MNHVTHLNKSEKSERGLFAKTRGPVLVQNVETLAHLALIARYGAGWFRSTGGVGTRLFTVHRRAENSAVVLELPDGMTLVDVARKAGISLADAPAVLVGGIQGRWAVPDRSAPASVTGGYMQKLQRDQLDPAAGIVFPLTAEECPLTISAQFLNYLAAENAGQCGPCTNGLPELAASFAQATTMLNPQADWVSVEVQRLAGLVAGRGMCKHPDATAAFAYRSLQAFADEAHHHALGFCNRKVAVASA